MRACCESEHSARHMRTPVTRSRNVPPIPSVSWKNFSLAHLSVLSTPSPMWKEVSLPFPLFDPPEQKCLVRHHVQMELKFVPVLHPALHTHCSFGLLLSGGITMYTHPPPRWSHTLLFCPESNDLIYPLPTYAGSRPASIRRCLGKAPIESNGVGARFAF